MMKKTLLFATLFAVYMQGYAIELKVPIGARGYLGEVTPPVSSATGYLYTLADHKADTANYRITLSTSGTIDTLPYFDEIGTSGIQFRNTTEPDSGFIVLTINGNLNASFLLNDNKTMKYVSSGVINGKSVNLNGLYVFTGNGTKSGTIWGIEPKAGKTKFFASTGSSANKTNPAMFTVSSYSAYAVGGGLKAGVYKLAPGIVDVTFFTYANGGSYATPALFDRDSNVTITALKSCKLTPSTQTNIQYPTQLSQNYPTPKNLASEQAVVQVSCYDAGKEGFLTLGPLNPRVAGSTTGMELTSSENNGGDLPYIATSATSQGDSVCNANSSDAIPYLGSQSISTIPGKDFTKSLFFNLCANGNIKPGKYKGAINVSVLVD